MLLIIPQYIREESTSQKIIWLKMSMSYNNLHISKILHAIWNKLATQNLYEDNVLEILMFLLLVYLSQPYLTLRNLKLEILFLFSLQAPGQSVHAFG